MSLGAGDLRVMSRLSGEVMRVETLVTSHGDRVTVVSASVMRAMTFVETDAAEGYEDVTELALGASP